MFGVKSVNVDLGAERVSPLCAAHSSSYYEWKARALAAVGT